MKEEKDGEEKKVKRVEDRKHLKDEDTELRGRSVDQNPEGQEVRAINPGPSGRLHLTVDCN